jgi:hypothetical protein
MLLTITYRSRYNWAYERINPRPASQVGGLYVCALLSAGTKPYTNTKIILRYPLQPGVCLKNSQIQGVKSRGREAYSIYGERHLEADNAGFVGF